VPTQPLELLATSPGGGELISEETIFAANFALWRVGVFNHLVEKQTRFNERHAAEIADVALTQGRREAIARAAEETNIGLHRDGIGEAASENGWWNRLTSAVALNIETLAQMEHERWWRHRGEGHLLLGDVLAGLFLLSAFAVTSVSLLR
jgi:hypothetical protein